MTAPQIILLTLMGIGLLTNAHLHGKPRTKNHNFWHSLISTIISLLLLWWGGFFK